MRNQSTTTHKRGKRVGVCLIAFLAVFAAAIAFLASPAPSTLAASTTPDSLVWYDGFGFHCNRCGGNGATAVMYTGNDTRVLQAIAMLKNQPAGSRVVEKGEQKNIFGTAAYPIQLVRIGQSMTWRLITGDDIVCMTCGGADWITYSNKNGVIRGVNIQVNHTGEEPLTKATGTTAVTETTSVPQSVIVTTEPETSTRP